MVYLDQHGHSLRATVLTENMVYLSAVSSVSSKEILGNWTIEEQEWQQTISISISGALGPLVLFRLIIFVTQCRSVSICTTNQDPKKSLLQITMFQNYTKKTTLK